MKLFWEILSSLIMGKLICRFAVCGNIPIPKCVWVPGAPVKNFKSLFNACVCELLSLFIGSWCDTKIRVGFALWWLSYKQVRALDKLAL